MFFLGYVFVTRFLLREGILTHADSNRGGGYFSPLFVRVSAFPHDISKTDAARITKLDVEMLHNESWKPNYFEVKWSKVEVTSYKNSASVGLCILVSACFF